MDTQQKVALAEIRAAVQQLRFIHHALRHPHSAGCAECRALSWLQDHFLMNGEETVKVDIVERAQYAIKYGNSDQLHRDLLDEVQRLRAAAGGCCHDFNRSASAATASRVKAFGHYESPEAFGQDV